jgi:hypothetical protein
MFDHRTLAKNWLTLYHFTRPENLPSIREHGLLPRPIQIGSQWDGHKAVWLTLRPEPAADFEQSIMLKVRLYAFDPLLRFDPESDPDFRCEDWRVYLGTIPPDKIEFPAIADSGDSEVQALADADPEFCEWRKWQSDDTSAPADDITPEQLDKLGLDCLSAANTWLRGASPEEVVAAAAADLEARLRFLRGQS